MSQYITGQGDITNPRSWQDVAAPYSVPPLEFNNVPTGTNYPLNGDGRYWWQGNAANPLTSAVLLLHMDGTNGSTSFPDSSPIGNVFTAGGATVNTGTVKFGTGAYSSGGGFNTGISAPLTLGGPLDLSTSGDFTIEGWFYTPDFTFNKILMTNTNLASAGWIISMDSTGQLIKFSAYIGGAQYTIQSPAAITINAWHYFTVTRVGNTYQVYLDGVGGGAPLTQAGTLDAGTGHLYIGAINPVGTVSMNFMDDIRITRKAVYTGNFTPPTAALDAGASATIHFIGDPVRRVTGTMALQWQITQYSTDGSTPYLQYSTDNGASYTQVALGGGQAPQSGAVIVSLPANTGLYVGIFFSGGVVDATAPKTQIALAITRNKNEGMTYDWSNPLDPLVYNSSRSDNPGYLSDTLANLRQRLLIRLGFSNQASNPPPGMAAFCNEMLSSAQTYLFRRYSTLHMLRMFRWKMVPGQRYYGVNDNDEDILGAFKLNPTRPIQWAGVQDVRNVWYPLIQGIPPQLYTMIDKPWRPARYEIKAALEIYPAPDQTYWLWLKGYTGLSTFASDSDITSIDSELVFLHALANAKAHYGQPDANNIEAQANAYKAELIAGTHQTARYVPGMVAVPPAIRPTLIGFDQN